uniref:non-specific serine/threonine protein kinase n=1 Tax=Chrysotila carterae TaxID=13221 RepID=A0A7S4BYH8_CHRCT
MLLLTPWHPLLTSWTSRSSILSANTFPVGVGKPATAPHCARLPPALLTSGSNLSGDSRLSPPTAPTKGAFDKSGGVAKPPLVQAVSYPTSAFPEATKASLPKSDSTILGGRPVGPVPCVVGTCPRTAGTPDASSHNAIHNEDAPSGADSRAHSSSLPPSSPAHDKAARAASAGASTSARDSLPRTFSITLHHDAAKKTVTIELTEAVVLLFYLSGCAVFIGKPYVLKRIGCDTVNAANQALVEAACLQRIKHPGVVRFEDVFLHRHENGGCSVHIVMEFCAGGDLIDRLQCRRNELPLTEVKMLEFLSTLCRTMRHVHECGILHRDLKSSNVFVTRNDRTVKLGDFGLACAGLSSRRLSASPRRHSRCGTDMYMSPEVEGRKPYGAASDTYSLGCVLLEMLLQRQLRERRIGEERKDSIKAALVAARRAHDWRCMPQLSALAWRMLDDNPKQRIDLLEAAAAAEACLRILKRPLPTPQDGAAAPSIAAAEPVRPSISDAVRAAAAARKSSATSTVQRRRLLYAD